jgi:hypothetical protein
MISNVGGTLGLFVGLSVVSIFEVTEILIEVIFILFRRKKLADHFERISFRFKDQKVSPLISQQNTSPFQSLLSTPLVSIESKSNMPPNVENLESQSNTTQISEQNSPFTSAKSTPFISQRSYPFINGGIFKF